MDSRDQGGVYSNENAQSAPNRDDRHAPHSVRLDEEKCRGCTSCIKNCPTQAIRVRNGKAVIISERCIDCGECIKTCQYNAKKAVTDEFDLIEGYQYRVAMPAPALYSQFRSARSRNHILTALKRIGFDDVFEVALGAEAVSNATRQYLKQENNLQGPVISTACPAIIKLIQVRYPSLIDNLLPLQAPVEVAAAMARKEAREKTGLSDRDIGIFFITPCAAKMDTMNHPLRGETSDISGMISFQEIYIRLRTVIRKLSREEEEELARATQFGVRWPNPGGESLALNIGKFIAVDGIHEVAEIFDTIENNNASKFDDIEFMECLACRGGCLGGPITVKNVYVSQVVMKTIRRDEWEKYHVPDLPAMDIDYRDLLWTRKPEHIPVDQLDTDILRAMEKMEMLETLTEGLPDIDCGACGAPSCRALAEDIVRGSAKLTDCVFKLRERVRDLANEMFQLEGVTPPTIHDRTSETSRKPDSSGSETAGEALPESGTASGTAEENNGKGGGKIDDKRFGGLYSGESINWRGGRR